METMRFTFLHELVKKPPIAKKPIARVIAANEHIDEDDICVKVEETPDIKTPNVQLKWYQFRTQIVWFNAIGFLAMHLSGLYGLLFILVPQVFRLEFANVLWIIVLSLLGGEGITIGAHRYWTHRTFKATQTLRVLLMIGQTIAGQNCCYIWARDHRQHHKYSDTDADPHNANRGFFFSHMGWLMMKKHPEVIKKGKSVYMADLEADDLVMFQKKYYKPLYIVFAMFIPMAVPMYFWGETFWNVVFTSFFFRYVLLLNITWCVNSVAHIFGTRPYDKDLKPVESTFVSFIGFGEGWHNYHHAFPWDYKAAEFGMHLNETRQIIEFFARIGWAYDLKEASLELVKKRIMKNGDGTHYSLSEAKPEENVPIKDDNNNNISSLSTLITDSYQSPLSDGLQDRKPLRRDIIRVRHG